MRARLDKRPSIERLRQVLAYEPDTGVIRWKITSGRAVAGREAGCLDKSSGYIRVRIDGFPIMAHHVAFALMTGRWPELIIDHIRGKEAGNAWGNLREVTHSQNILNKPIFRGPMRAPERLKQPRRRPTVEEVRAALVYDKETGILRWGEGGAEAGRLNEDGYVRIGMHWRQYPAHVLAVVIIKGYWPKNTVDHKNNVRSDNRWDNLREATQSQNVANSRLSSRNTSGFKGVSYVRQSGRWAAYIKVKGVARRIGEFDTPEEAHEAYKREAVAVWGKFANFG
jgi:hypothetical protein